jgi:hypothetical protein
MLIMNVLWLMGDVQEAMRGVRINTLPNREDGRVVSKLSEFVTE